LRDYFEAHHEGRDIWKWDHYFDMYHRHLSKFVGLDLKLVEIGIYSGGSLEMWGSYFGPRCHVYGVDIENACKAYESEKASVFIGDQESPEFWRNFKANVGTVDILIDDGGHTPEQQTVTLNEMLEAIRPGGVYICEDIHGHRNSFINYAVGASFMHLILQIIRLPRKAFLVRLIKFSPQFTQSPFILMPLSLKKWHLHVPS
jgi:hypothetical protein